MKDKKRSVLVNMVNAQETTAENTNINDSVEHVTNAIQKSNVSHSSVPKHFIELKEVKERFVNLSILRDIKENRVGNDSSQCVNVILKTIPAHADKGIDDMAKCSLGIFLMSCITFYKFY